MLGMVWERVMWKAFGILIIALLAGCRWSDEREIAIDAATPRPVVSASFGEKVTFDDGTTIQALRLDQRFDVTAFRLVPSGFHFIGVDVEHCAARDIRGAVSVSVYPSDFVIVMQDTTRYTTTSLGGLTEFPAVALLARECVRGWIPFQVPSDAQVHSLEYTEATWTSQRRSVTWLVHDAS